MWTVTPSSWAREHRVSMSLMPTLRVMVLGCGCQAALGPPRCQQILYPRCSAASIKASIMACQGLSFVAWVGYTSSESGDKSSRGGLLTPIGGIAGFCMSTVAPRG